MFDFNLFTVFLTLLSALLLPSVCQNSCGTNQNPYCAGNSVFEQLCCPYPNVCYWQNRSGQPGCCPAGQVCDGTSPYYPSTPTSTLTIRTTTIHPSTITITPTPSQTTVGGGGVIIVTTIPNGPSVITITTQPNVVTITTNNGGCNGGVCYTVTSVVGGVYSTVTSGVGGVYSTVTSVVAGGFSTVTSKAGGAFSTVSGVLVGVASAAPSSTIVSISTLVLAISFTVAWNTFG